MNKDKKMTIEEMEKIINEHCRIIADDEIVVKKSEYEALKKDFEEWRAEYDHNCLLRLEVFELEKQLEKAKQETREILTTLYTYLKEETEQTTVLLIVKALAERYGIELE